MSTGCPWTLVNTSFDRTPEPWTKAPAPAARKMHPPPHLRPFDRSATAIANDDLASLAPGGRHLARRPLCSYAGGMNVATTRAEVGIRELKNGLSGYIDRVRGGEEVIVTDRGRPVARLSSLDAPHDRLAELVAAGVVRAPSGSERYLPKRRIKPKGSVSELVADQRR